MRLDPEKLRTAIGSTPVRLVAQRAKVTADCIYKLMSGTRKKPSIETLSVIANALDKELADLCFEETDETGDTTHA